MNVDDFKAADLMKAVRFADAVTAAWQTIDPPPFTLMVVIAALLRIEARARGRTTAEAASFAQRVAELLEKGEL